MRYANELVDAVDKVLFFGVADTAFRLDRVRFWPNRYARATSSWKDAE